MGGLVDRAYRALTDEPEQPIGVVEELAFPEQRRGGDNRRR